MMPLTSIMLNLNYYLTYKQRYQKKYESKSQQLSQSNKMYMMQEIVEWRQQWKVNVRKYEDSEKTCNKILHTFAELNPQFTMKTNMIISERDAQQKKQEKQSQAVFNKMKKINQSVDELRETLKYFDKTNECLVKIQKVSEGIFNKMETMKGEMANGYDQLDDLQRKITADLELIDRRVQSFDDELIEQKPVLPTKIKNKENISTNNKDQKKNPVQEQQYEQQAPKQKIQIIEEKMKLKEQQVEKVDQEISDLGKFLGWHQEDHKDFITIWNRNQPNKTYFQIQDQLVQYFKMYTNQQIIQHMNRYMKLKKLNDKKKNLINQYKELKQQKKAQQILKIRSNQHEKQLKRLKQQQIKRAEQEQKEMKQKVESWKKQKQQQKIEEQRRALEEQQRRKQQQLALRKQQEIRRKQIIQRKRQQEQEKKQKQKEKQKQPPKRPHSAVNKQTRDRIRQRQQQLIRQKMEKAIQKKMQQQQLFKKAEKIKQQKMIKFAYVNSKLEQKTTAVKEKQREKFDGKEKKDANTFGGQLLLTGVRAVPQWRQGL